MGHANPRLGPGDSIKDRIRWVEAQSLPSKEGTTKRLKVTFTKKPGTEPGPDCLICAEFTRERTE